MAAKKTSIWARYDAQRKKPRVTIVLTPEDAACAKRLAEARGQSLSVFVARLIQAELARESRPTERKKASPAV